MEKRRAAKDFHRVKRICFSMPRVTYPNPELPICLYTDVSSSSHGLNVYQHREKRLRNCCILLICSFTKTGQYYDTMEKECLAKVWVSNQTAFTMDLTERRFAIFTDHCSLKAVLGGSDLMSSRELSWR